jgi:hypothetical protein
MPDVPISDKSLDLSTARCVSALYPLPQNKQAEGKKKLKIHYDISEVITSSQYKQNIENKRVHSVTRTAEHSSSTHVKFLQTEAAAR